MDLLVNRTLSSGVSTALAMMALLSCSDLTTEPNALELDDPSGDPAALVASIEVTLASSSLQPGQTTQATAILLNQSGDTITRAVNWSSSDPTVATVSNSGLVAAIAPGTVTITASRRSRSGAAILTVTGGGTTVTAPGTVSDLSVSAVESNSVTLSFTQVDDGTGKPASYDVRYAVAPISWGDAASATSGTCTTPVTGTGIGSRLTCTVLGLSASTNYNFQLVAFRGTLNMNAVFGGLSNIVLTTTSNTTTPVATVTVGLVNASLTVGETTQATATTRDANNNVLTGRAISWSSSNNAVASVSALGLVTAIAAGTAQIIATCDGKSGSAAINVQSAPVGSGSVNEPTGMTPITERPFSVRGEGGWYDQDTPDLTIVQDASAPRSPSSIMQQRFAAGFGGGASAAVVEKGLGGKYTTIYISYWIKYSSNWYGHPTSAVNKQMHLWINGGNHVFTLAYGGGTAPLKAEIWLQGTAGGERNLYANLGNPGTITRGKWHRWEIVLQCNTNGAANGSVEWWIDGAKIGQYYDVRLEPITSYWEIIQWSPTWGGTGSTVPADQFESLDHIYISGKN